YRLLRAADPSKDQSYFLHGLTQEELALVRFPLGTLSKTQVRALARQRGLPNADKPESMEVCFVAGTPLPRFLEENGVAPAARSRSATGASRSQRWSTRAAPKWRSSSWNRLQASPQGRAPYSTGETKSSAAPRSRQARASGHRRGGVGGGAELERLGCLVGR